MILPDGSTHVPHFPRRNVADILAFLMVLHRVKRSRTNRYPGVPNILDAILRDATVHFIVIFVSQLVFQLFVFVAPVSEASYVCSSWSYRAHHTCIVCIFSWTSSSCLGCEFSSSSTPDQVIDINLRPTGRARFSHQSWRHASCSP